MILLLRVATKFMNNPGQATLTAVPTNHKDE